VPSTDAEFLRLHLEAVWGVQLPPVEQSKISLLPGSPLPDWRLCVAALAAGRVSIWRPDVTPDERKQLLARLEEVLLLPDDSEPPAGVSREVAFRWTATPVVDYTSARRIARPLLDDDYALVKTFQPGDASKLFQPGPRPLIGVIVDGRLLSLAHSSRRTAQACELGIDTLPDARRRGYALAATIAWSAAICQEGLTPIYSALSTNSASLKLAVAAGYREFARAVTLE
jgi:hypothetical protein